MLTYHCNAMLCQFCRETARLFDAVLKFEKISIITHQSLKPNFQHYCRKSESFLQGYNDDIP